MKTETMTIHEALAELKMLDNRIFSKINGSNFAVANKHSNGKIAGKTIDAYLDAAESNYQSITDLLNRRKAIRNALSQSNAVTKVMVGGHEYTIAEAIEMKKTGMSNYHALLSEMTRQLSEANSTIRRENDRLVDKADQYVAGLLGSKEKVASTDAEVLRKAYIDANTYDLVAVKDLQENIQQLSDEIMAFEAEVDAKISISNALTTITFEY